MNDLRQAAEMALEALEDIFGKEKKDVGAINALRQALAHEALDRMVAENQRLGLYDDLQTAIERGTKAWADVPADWVEDLRGNTPDCKTHPDAPHGFDRNASHSADRYVCECEGWEPVDNVDMSEKRIHKTDKSIHELDLEAPLTVNGVPLYPKKEWVGLTVNEVLELLPSSKWKAEETLLFVQRIEDELKERNT